MAASSVDTDRRLSAEGLRDLLAVINSSRGLDEILEYLLAVARRRNVVLDLHLVDDGRGFDPNSAPPGHLGLAIMHERARAIGAQLHIQSSPGDGTQVDVHCPGVSST